MKQPVNINFSKGLNTKTDPWQVPVGEFLSLENSIFTKGGQLRKRNGYGSLPSLPTGNYNYLTTVNGNLTAIGEDIAAYNSNSKTWGTKGSIQPLTLDTLALIRNSVNQAQCDAAVAPNGLVCTVYTETNAGASVYKYAIADSVTGQNIISPTLIPVTSGVVTGSPRVFVLGSYFIIVFTNVITATSHLQYIAVSTMNPAVVTTNQNIAAAYISATTVSWDGLVFNNNLYIAYNQTAGGQAVKVTYLSIPAAAGGSTPVSPITFTGYKATMMSLCVDSTGNSPVIYVSFYDLSSFTGFTAAIDVRLNLLMNPVRVIPSGTILNITSAAMDGTCYVYYEVSNAYTYDALVATNLIKMVSVRLLGNTFNSIFSTAAGTITASSATGLVSGMYLVDNSTAANIAANTTFTVSGTTLTLSINTAGNSASSPGDKMTTATLTAAVTVIRSVGLASKAFIAEGAIYFLTAYSSALQASYFLVAGTSLSSSPKPIGKLAWENGGGYLTLGLPSVTVTGSVAYIAYLFKDLIEPIAVINNTQQTIGGGIYAQTGINLSRFDFSLRGVTSVEAAKGLQIGGGFGWLYDGYLPVEQNFLLYPDNIEVTGTGTAGNMNTQQYYYQVVYEWSDNQGNIQRSAASVPTSYTIIAASGTFTGERTSGSAVLGNVSSFTGLQVGQPLSGTGIPAGAYILSTNTLASTITMSANATSGSATTTTLTPSSVASVIVSVPTIRLTYKIANPVKIVIYRWSVAQQVYYQVTSISSATLNDTTVDAVSFTDTHSDASIIGNSIIYTTGGVVEDVSPPASNVMSLFDTRVWLVDAEDKNLLWYSKSLVEATPVEWSDLLTFYIAPNAGTVSTTGPITALAPMDDKLIIFKENAMYYINGQGPDNTGNPNPAYNGPIFITATVGCQDPHSIVLVDDGLMFQSNKGIWILPRGVSAPVYIGAAVERFNSSVVESAVSVPTTNEIRQTLSTGQTLLFDYFYNQWGTFTGVPAVSSCIFQNYHSFINEFGQSFQETPGAYLDGANPVLMAFKTGWINLAAIQGFERFYYFYLIGQYYSPHKLQVQIAYNYNESATHSVLISPSNFSASTPSPFGEQPAPFGSPINLEQWKIDTRIQKCQSFQLTVQEIFDPTFGTIAGAGLTLSGINMMVSVKRGTRPIRASQSTGLK